MLRACFFFLWSASIAWAAEDITGFWKTVDDEGAPQCILAIYEYQERYYGRIIGTFSDEGELTDSIYHPYKKAPALVGDPYYSGLDIIYDLEETGSKFKGKILNPKTGSVYNAELWREDEDLIVRGKLLFFGKNHTWLPVKEEDFPSGFTPPDTNTFIPHIPEQK